jgi:glycosyltransferase involved in cell wall biosynthesis
MVTMASNARLPMLKRSLRNYLEQTYINKELIIVADSRFASGFKKIEALVRSLDRDDVRLFRAPKSTRTLGALRNLSIARAQGTLLCQWDDDDAYSPDRLQKQWSALRAGKKKAVYLQTVWQYFERRKTLSYMDWKRCWPGCHTATGMFYKNICPRYPESGPRSHKQEDLVFFLRLAKRCPVLKMRSESLLYIYSCHGKNTSSSSFIKALEKTVSDPSKTKKIDTHLRKHLKKSINLRAVGNDTPPGVGN